ncbi:phage holin family protein [Clostridium sp. 'deep sea']|nr:phage holin family protein [Clostridium sp. 'deep sea']
MWLVTIAGGAFTSLIGGYDSMVKILLIFIALDYISGMIASIIEHKLSSKVGFKGVAKKVLILMLVVIGHQVDILLGFTILRSAIISFYIANEIISILENVNRMGLETPKILNMIIELLQKNANPPLPENKDND